MVVGSGPVAEEGKRIVVHVRGCFAFACLHACHCWVFAALLMPLPHLMMLLPPRCVSVFCMSCAV